MAKPLVIVSFANNASEPLPNLEKEKELVLKIIEDAKLNINQFDYKTPTTRAEIVELLANEINQKNLVFFSFSGHATGDSLITENEETNTKGIATLLSFCNNLKLIILNGCSTEGQVGQIYDAFAEQRNPQEPVLIATNASVGDNLAKEFGVTFFDQVFTSNRNILEAFKIAMGAVETLKKEKIKIDESEIRSLGRKSKVGNWGIYVPDDKTKDESATFTIKQCFDSFVTSTYKPNQFLLKTIIKSLVPFDSIISTQYNNDRKNIVNTTPYISRVHALFPYPISRRLVRLEAAKSINDNSNDFFNTDEAPRLGELLRTYQTIVDILFGIAQSQLYGLLLYFNNGKNQENLDKLLSQKQLLLKIKNYYEKKQGIDKFSKTDLLKIWVELLSIFDEFILVKELSTFSKANKSDFYELGKYFEDLFSTYSKMSNEEAKGLLELTEIKLAKVFECISFISNYKLVSVENIFLKHEHRKIRTRYSHQIYYHQKHEGKEPKRDKGELEIPFDNFAVILMNEPNNLQPINYLNLSPFLIDEVIFKLKADISNLLAFDTSSSTPNGNKYLYRFLIFNESMPENHKRRIEFIESIEDEVVYENEAYYEINEKWEEYLKLLNDLIPNE